MNGDLAYSYTPSSAWTLIDSDEDSGEFVYGFGTESALVEIAPGDSTDVFCNGFKMKETITGKQLNGMMKLDIDVIAYMVDASEESEVGN